MEKVILVDSDDNSIGEMDKLEVHQKGLLHRAFSIILFNTKGEMLLQKRAVTKYHSGGLWTNTCCSHPAPGESMEGATNRKLKQEMGIDITPEYAFKFIYHSWLDNNLTEHELDHVFIGTFDGTPLANKDEVEDWKFVPLETLRQDVRDNPGRYTVWFRLILEHPEFLALAS